LKADLLIRPVIPGTVLPTNLETQANEYCLALNVTPFDANGSAMHDKLRKMNGIFWFALWIR